MINITLTIIVLGLLPIQPLLCQWQRLTWDHDTNGVDGLYAYKGRLFATSRSSSVYVSADHCNTWLRKDNGLPHGPTLWHSVSGNTSYLFLIPTYDSYANIQDSIYRTSDFGDNWTPATYHGIFISPFQIIANETELYVSDSFSQNIYISRSNGNDWIQRDITDAHSAMYYLAVIDSVIFVSTIPSSRGAGQLFRSSNDGLDWGFYMDYGIFPSSWINQIESSGSDLYVSCLWFLGYGGTGGGIVHSSDLGINWTVITNSIPNSKPTVLHASGKNLFACILPQGLFFTSDKGNNWININHGTPFGDLSVSSITTDSQYIYVSSSLMSGVYRYSLHDVLEISHDETSRLNSIHLSNLPNPFSVITTIHYAIPSQGNVSINVHDMLGRLVKTIVSEIKPPGQYEANFSADGLPNGMYLCTLEAGGVRLVNKMVLFR